MDSDFNLLMVDESDEDALRLRNALPGARHSLKLCHVRSPEEARDYLLGQGNYGDRAQYPFPSVVFADRDALGEGLQLLTWIRDQPKIRSLPCIIYSTAASPAEVQFAYDLGVTSFILKPDDFQEWLFRFEVMLKFWMEIAQRP